MILMHNGYKTDIAYKDKKNHEWKRTLDYTQIEKKLNWDLHVDWKEDKNDMPKFVASLLTLDNMLRIGFNIFNLL